MIPKFISLYHISTNPEFTSNHMNYFESTSSNEFWDKSNVNDDVLCTNFKELANCGRSSDFPRS